MKLQSIKRELRKLVPAFAQRVAPVYAVLKWEWSPGGQLPCVPDAKEIEETLYTLIDGLTEEFPGNGTGGLEVYFDGEGGESGLVFKIEEKSFLE